MKSLSRNNQADIIEAFNSTSRYLDDLLNIDNVHFEQMDEQKYPAELQLNEANYCDTETPFVTFNVSISNGLISAEIHDKLENCDFDMSIFGSLTAMSLSIPRMECTYFLYNFFVSLDHL